MSPATPLAARTPSAAKAELQAAVGNREMLRRTAPAVQTKLRVSLPGDAHEREADRVAEAVMARPEPTVQRQAGADVDTDEEELAATRPEVARQADVDTDEEELAAPKGDGQAAMSPAVEGGIARSRGGGHPLDAATRAFFEPRFGRDLGGVKVHTDAHAAGLAGDLRAQAFTVGNDIYFSGGRYQPGSATGQALLAHELTHTIQQQPGARLEGSVGPPAETGTTHRHVQRQDDQGQGGAGPGPGAAGGAGPGAAGAGGTPAPVDAGTVDEAQGRIVYPVLKLADFKAQGPRLAKYQAQTVVRSKVFERGDPQQTTVWDASVPDKPIEDKLKSRLASTFDPANPAKVYALKHARSDYHLVGTLPDMVARAKRPIWDPAGNPRPKDVDHVVELQISGWPGAAWANQAGASGNMELLDSQANQDSGRRIMREVGRLVKASRDAYWRRPTDPAGAVAGTDGSFWVKPKPPTIASIKKRYDLVFSQVATGLGQAGRPENSWQWTEIAESTRHLDDLNPATNLAGQGNWTVFPDPAGGIPKELAHTSGADSKPKSESVRTWFSPFTIRTVNLQDPGQLAGDAATDIGSITLALDPAAGRTPYGFDLDQPIQVRRIVGIPNAGHLDADGLSAVWRALTIRGLSPVEISSWTVVPGRGIQARGQLLPTVPLIADLGIDFVIDGDELRLSKLFDLGELALPGPIQITDSSLEVFAGTRGIGARGEVGLGLEGVAQGRIEARVDSQGGLALAGTLTFDPELFDPPSQIRVAYENGELSGSGTLTIGDERVRGIKRATITASYAQGRLDARGDAQLAVPGLQAGTMSLTYSETEGFAITGTFELAPDVPGIRSGSVSARVARGPDGAWSVSASGQAVPAIPGVDAQIDVSYADGVFTAEGTAAYRRGMLSGSLRLGATNRPVDDQGNPGEGPTPRLRAFGGGSLTLRIAPWLAATAGVRLLPNSEVEVTGQVGLPEVLEVFPARRYDRNIFRINLDIPIVGVSVLGQRIGIFATIGGGLDLTAGFGPGQLRQLQLAVTYNPDHEDQTRVTGQALFVVPADAGLRLFVRGALGAGIPVVSASAGLELGGRLGIQGAVSAGVQVAWSPTQGLALDAVADISAEPRFRFDITGFVLVEADLLFSTIELYSKRWELAAVEYGSGLRLGASFPVHYREGEPFEVALDDIQFQVPDIDPKQVLTGLVDQIA